MKASNIFSLDNITIGTDVEFALYDNSLNNFIPADEDLIDMGVKKNPIFLIKTSTGNEAFIERDVVNAEFTFKNTYKLNEAIKMWTDIEESRKAVEDKIKENTGRNISLPYISFVEHNKNILKSKPEKKYFERGCDPDMNAWLFIPNIIDDCVRKSTKYGCGFHIHIGFDNLENIGEFELANLIKLLDFYVGQHSNKYDKDTKRRIESGYGKSGSFRIKPYGVEYRVLGTGFISKESIEFLFNNIQKALNDMFNYEFIDYISMNTNIIQDAIDNYNNNILK